MNALILKVLQKQKKKIFTVILHTLVFFSHIKTSAENNYKMK